MLPWSMLGDWVSFFDPLNRLFWVYWAGLIPVVDPGILKGLELSSDPCEGEGCPKGLESNSDPYEGEGCPKGLVLNSDPCKGEGCPKGLLTDFFYSFLLMAVNFISSWLFFYPNLISSLPVAFQGYFTSNT